MFAGKHAPGSAEPGEDFVSDHQDAIGVAKFPDSSQKLRGPHDHSASALEHRFDNYCSDTFRTLRKDVFQAPQEPRPGSPTVQSKGAAIAVRGVGAMHRKKQWLKCT